MFIHCVLHAGAVSGQLRLLHHGVFFAIGVLLGALVAWGMNSTDSLALTLVAIIAVSWTSTK
jgi:hypothetical protein